jgi:hypothetical protein
MNDAGMGADGAALAGRTCFVPLVGSADEEASARLLGLLGECAVWVFALDPDRVSRALSGMEGVSCLPLAMDPELRYPFAVKVQVCAQAEALAADEVRSLVWVTTQCLIVNPPVLFDLPASFDAAFRPVHIQNIGSLASEPLDNYWSEVYRAVGMDDTSRTVESFVDSRELRPYLNTHLFAIDPSQGLCQTWLQLFREMVADKAFQSGPCQDQLHRIFLHQAILSALVTKRLEWQRICLLPPEYSYPLHLHPEVSAVRRSQSLGDLVCPVYEGVYRYPETLNGLPVQEPLKSWLMARGQRRRT